MIKNKITSIIVIVLTAALLSGCGGDNNSSTNNSDNLDSSKNVNIEESATEETETPPILIDQIKVDISIGKHDDNGTKYVTGTLTNNSNMPIRICNITIRNTKTNEDNNLVFKEQTILPKDTNSEPITFALKSGDEKNLEIIKYDFALTDRNGNDIIVEYDPKSKTYDWH